MGVDWSHLLQNYKLNGWHRLGGQGTSAALQILVSFGCLHWASSWMFDVSFWQNMLNASVNSTKQTTSIFQNCFSNNTFIAFPKKHHLFRKLFCCLDIIRNSNELSIVFHSFQTKPCIYPEFKRCGKISSKCLNVALTLEAFSHS